MSENKEESNSTSSDIKEEEDGSPKAEDIKTDESSKDSEKDSVKNDSIKDDSEKDDSEKDDSEDESDEEEIGLLDRPVEVSGCRARKKVERLEVSFATAKEKAQPIQDGKGKKLGECPRIEFQIQKTSNNELKPLHRILFNRVGGATEIKKNIRKFSGFTFGRSSSEYERKKAQIEKLTGPILKQMCAVLDIERGGLKEEIVKRVLEFLLEPKDSGKSVTVSKKKSSTKDKKKAPAKKGKQTKAKIEIEISDDSDVVDDSASDKKSDDDEDDDDDKDAESEDDSDVEIKKKNAKKPLPKSKKVEKKEKPKKEEKKGSAKGSKRKRGDSDDNLGEPATKKKMPSDDDIKKLVKRILAAADLQEITMKKVIKQVADAFPACDLTQKKAFIKSTIKSCIS